MPMGVIHGAICGPRRFPAELATDPEYVTPVKTRILGGGTHTTKQQMVRIDKRTRLRDGVYRRSGLAGGLGAPPPPQ